MMHDLSRLTMKIWVNTLTRHSIYRNAVFHITLENTSPGTKIKRFTCREGMETRNRKRRFQEKLLVYHPAWCLDTEITCSWMWALDKTIPLSFPCYHSLIQPGVKAIPIHLVWVTREEPYGPLRLLLTQKIRAKVSCEVTGTSLFRSFSVLVVEERDMAYNHPSRLSQSSLEAFRGKAITVFPKHRLYLGGPPRYINSCQSIFGNRV